jgi:hypothetical protein
MGMRFQIQTNAPEKQRVKSGVGDNTTADISGLVSETRMPEYFREVIRIIKWGSVEILVTPAGGGAPPGSTT